MGLTYTRKEMRTLVGQLLRDSNAGMHPNAKKNRIINRVHREFIERSEANRNVLVFSLADATADGVIEYDKNANAPTITLVDVEGRNYYQIDNCILIDKISRWDDTDYSFKEIFPKTQYEIDGEALLQSTDTKPVGYQQLDTPDTFQFLPELDITGYPYKFEVRYREGVRDLITFDASPTDSTVIQTIGAGASDFTAQVTGATMASRYKIVIAAEDTGEAMDLVDTFKDIYDGNGWIPINTNEELTGVAQALANNVTYTAADTDNHTAGDEFEFAVDDFLTPSCPEQFRHILIDGICAELLKIERDPAWQVYGAPYEIGIERTKRKSRRLNTDQASRFRTDYTGAGG